MQDEKNKIQKGDFVKMSQHFKDLMIDNDCEDHVTEFGDCIGVVEDPMFPNGDGPEVNVRWMPSGLRYGYDPERDLIKVEEKVKLSLEN